MGRQSNGRDAYFEKHVASTVTPEAYIEALKQSPYRKHRRAAIALRPQFESLKALREQEKQLEQNTEDIPTSRPDDND